jgi:putative membrane protein
MTTAIGIVATSLLLLASSAQAQTAPTDAQIAAIVVAANQVDIDAGKLAETRGSTPEVKAFGKRMVLDHTSSNQRASELAQKLNLKPEPGETSKSLTKGGEEMRAKLKKLEGADFDRAYVDNEVKFHQTVIDTVDETLLPNAKNPQLKALLEQTRPTLVSHLEHAKQIQEKMGE